VLKLGYTSLIFVDPRVKVSGAYYLDMLLSQQLLPAISQVSGEFLIVQQDSALAHRACETISLLQRETPAFILPDLWSPNNPDHNPVNYQIWGISEPRQKCTGGRFEAASDWCLDWYSTKRYLRYH